jgi:HemY protein
MLWSLLKVLIFVAVVALLALAGGWLAETADGLRVIVAGYELTLGPVQAVIALLLLAVALWLALKVAGLIVAILRFLSGDENALRRYLNRRAERKGVDAMGQSLVALAAGEGRLALARAEKAAKYLDRPEATQVLVAQAALAAGNTARAGEAFKAMLGAPETRFVGIRGLMQQKLAEGDTETALKLAEKAVALKPRHAETQATLLKLQQEQKDWSGARSTLGAQLKAGSLPRDVYRRRDAVLALQQARGVFDEGATIEAREAAIAANRQSPDLIPAAAMAARALADKGDRKGATRVIKKAWSVLPHPDLAAAFADIEPDESPARRIRRFKDLIGKDMGEEAMLTMAELYIADEDFPAAKRAMGDITTRHPTRRAMALMAAIARGEGADDQVVRGWLARAVIAPRGAQWVCNTCHAVHATWAPICDNCGGFDTLAWAEPAETPVDPARTAAVLPLIVGQPAAAPADDAIDATAEPPRPA